MKKTIMNFLAMMPFIVILAGCNNNTIGVKELEPYLFETKTYKKLDYSYADKYFAETNDNWSGGGCSAITKTIDGNHRIVGRNMDLNISNNCAYIIKTDAGKYKTIGLQYTFRDISPKYDYVKKHGVTAEWSKLIPFYCDDVMNDQGLYIELNMRHGEEGPDGKDLFSCSGTNPNSNKRIHMFEIPRYISENCASISEAKEYVKTLDVYSKNHNWNYCFLLADKLGKASLLEFSSNQIHWIDEENVTNHQLEYLDESEYFGTLNYHAIAQTNFFINEDAFSKQDTKSGFGRMQTLQANIDSVNSKQDMYNLMKKVAYSNFYKPYEECKTNHFDPRDELIGEAEGLTAQVVMSPEMEPRISEYLNAASESFHAMTREEQREANQYWESSFTEVVDINEKSIFVRFYENENSKYLITFDGVKKTSNI